MMQRTTFYRTQLGLSLALIILGVLLLLSSCAPQGGTFKMQPDTVAVDSVRYPEVTIMQRPYMMQLPRSELYRKWYALLQYCSQVRGPDFNSLTFIAIETGVAGFAIEPITNQRYGGVYDRGRRLVYIDSRRLFEYAHVGHELAHALGFRHGPWQAEYAEMAAACEVDPL